MFRKNVVITSDKSGTVCYAVLEIIAKTFGLKVFSTTIISHLLALEHFSNLPEFSLVNLYLDEKNLEKIFTQYGKISNSDYQIYSREIWPAKPYLYLMVDGYALRALHKGGWVLDGNLIPYFLKSGLSKEITNTQRILRNFVNFKRSEFQKIHRNTYIFDVESDTSFRVEVANLNRKLLEDNKNTKQITEKDLNKLDEDHKENIEKLYQIDFEQKRKVIDAVVTLINSDPIPFASKIYKVLKMKHLNKEFKKGVLNEVNTDSTFRDQLIELNYKLQKVL